MPCGSRTHGRAHGGNPPMQRVCSSLVVSLALTLAIFAPAEAAQECPKGLKSRAPEQVLAEHRAALAAGDLDLAMCNFAPDAVVIHDNGIDRGHDAIRASLAFLL